MAIYNDRMYFGNRNRMTWVMAPKIQVDASRRGWYSTSQFTNGGAFVRRSSTGAKGYNFSWDLKPRDEIRAVTDYAEYVYGDGPIYFLDPFAMDKNLLPQYWATPSLAAGDAPLLVGEFDSDRPDKIVTPINSIGYPYESAVYTLDGSKVTANVWIPCPPGFTLWFGAHGSSTGTAAVSVLPTTGPKSVSDSITIPWLLATDETRVNLPISGNTFTGAFLKLTGTGTITLHGLMAQVLPDGATPLGGGFVSGQGHSGCSFAEDPVLTNYSAAKDLAGASVNLVETEGWQ